MLLVWGFFGFCFLWGSCDLGFYLFAFLGFLVLIWKDFWNISKHFWVFLVFTLLGRMNVLRVAESVNLFCLKSGRKKVIYRCNIGR